MIVVVYGHCLLAKSRTDYVAYFVFLVQSMLLCSLRFLAICSSQRKVIWNSLNISSLGLFFLGLL